MRMPSSLAGRLSVMSAVSIGCAVLVAALIVLATLQRFTTGQIDQRLEAQAFAIAAVLRSDLSEPGRLGGFIAPPFDRPRSGWTWRVDGPSGPIASSTDQRPRGLDDPRPLDGPSPPRPPRDEAEPRNGPPPSDRALHTRQFAVTVDGRNLTITVTAPARAITDPLWDVASVLLPVLLGLGLVLVLATFGVVRLGLKPLGQLTLALSDVRAGRASSVPQDQPKELTPLAQELNRLLNENAQNLVRARQHVANLAHGLKTPLADLALTLRGAPAGSGTDALALVERMDRRIRHHLARARAAALDGPAAVATPVAPHVEGVLDVLGRIHADRGLSFSRDVPASMLVAVEAQDLDEMLGNLLDNACRYATGRVSICAGREGADILIRVEDDGPGLAPGEIPQALAPGGRLDEMTPGHGFGLPITRELAELYGGGLTIEAAGLSGLAVSLRLPGQAS
ncbi:sensor histidine kinase [Aureimonas frigidaquae]|uniref:histidine kinase n=1 Tax=Aureimonas frigidaquae TaxID=424757 RepID=A0A0P0Z3R2_9HYPH|nr:HAMP domain-containing sensor histidine kinase [Aureimonas frigidaquae]BAT28670.1 two component sensor kinase [Aureimonas frigidaquae]